MNDARQRYVTSCAPAPSLWSQLGLRWNPFRVLPPDELTEHALVPVEKQLGITVDRLLSLEEPLVELSAPEGIGKTTVLRVAESALRDLGTAVTYHYLTPDRSDRFPSLDCEVLLLDEIQRLHRSERRRLAGWLRRGDGRAICATHRWWRPRGVPMQALRVALPGAGAMREFFRMRVGYAGAGDVELTDDAAQWLATEVGTLRKAEWLLYEVFQEQVPSLDKPPQRTSTRIDVEDLAGQLKRLRQYKAQAARQTGLHLRGLFSRPGR